VRVAVWTPLPPQRGEVARHAHVLLAALARDAGVAAVARDDVAEWAEVPEGVAVVAASDYQPDDYDIDVYEIGNDAAGHGFVHGPALRRPGLLILGDPALVGFYRRLAGDVDGAVFREEVAFNLPGWPAPDPPGPTGDGATAEPLRLLMSRRLVEASLMTVVHSAWAAEVLSGRSPGADVVCAPRAVELPDPVAAREGGATVFGVIGGHADRDRVALALAAFGEVHREFAGVGLVIGAADDSHAGEAIAALVRDSGLVGSVSQAGRVSAAGGFAALLDRCDVLVDLTTPTAGGVSTLVLGALGAGRPVIVSEALQYRGLDERFCWTVSTDPVTERTSLVARLRAAADAERARAAGRIAASVVRPALASETLGAKYLELVRVCASRRRERVETVLETVVNRRTVGVNAIGSWEATTGLTEAARRSVGALVDAGVEVSLEDYDYGAPRDPRRLPVELRILPKGRAHDVDLCFLNVNELTVVPDAYLRRRGRHRIVAYWHWEQVSLPAELQAQFDRVDEVWVSSSFTAEAFRHYTTKPLSVVPCVVEPVADASLRRADFGLPDGSCLFLYHFDVSSTLARKNPRGVIEAYRRAFSRAERAGDVHLVMKTINLASHPEMQAVLGDAVKLVGGTIIDTDMRPEEVAALTALCDVYVSLHRAEGFGLGLAEAMYLAKPVIGTAYSGNMDYMTLENSCPVGYRMAQIDLGDMRFNRRSLHIYRPGGWWADPDIDEAARWMRRLYEDEGLRRRLGAAAAATMRARCNSRVLGEQMRLLLERGGRDAGARRASQTVADPAGVAPAGVADRQPIPVEGPS